MVFENGAKNIQAAAYNGARTVYQHLVYCFDNNNQKKQSLRRNKQININN